MMEMLKRSQNQKGHQQTDHKGEDSYERQRRSNINTLGFLQKKTTQMEQRGKMESTG